VRENPVCMTSRAAIAHWVRSYKNGTPCGLEAAFVGAHLVRDSDIRQSNNINRRAIPRECAR